MNGYLVPTQPVRLGTTLLASNVVAFALAASPAETSPSSSMRVMTTSRRSMAARGWCTGSVATGFWVRPASMAAWASVRSLALTLK